MEIRLHVIPHNEHRYDTVGDWIFDHNGDLDIWVSKMIPVYEYLVFIHEQVEAFACREAGIAEEDCAAFDMAYEECRRLKLPAPCGCTLHEEPGLDLHAPYSKQHYAATQAEFAMAMVLGVDWEEYDNYVCHL